MTEGLYKGDCLDWLRSLPDNCGTLAIVDGPYNLRLAGWDAFATWDDFRAFYTERLDELARVLAENACMYVFGNFKSLAELNQCVEGVHGWELRQCVTWDKGIGNAAGRCSHTLRMHPIVSEFIAFYARERVDVSALAWDGVTREDNQVREYLNAERERAGWSVSAVNKAWQERVNNPKGGMAGHWFGRSQWALPTRENYEWLRSLFNRNRDEFLRREYEDLRREYEDLRREYEDLRYPFKQLQCVTDVWQVPTCSGSERVKAADGKAAHVAQKPVEIMRRIVESSSRPGDLVLDPFLGLGSTAVACIRLGRRWAGAEITEEYWPIIEARVAHAERTRQPELFGGEVC